MREILAEECEHVGATGIAKDLRYDYVIGGWPTYALAAMDRVKAEIAEEAAKIAEEHSSPKFGHGPLESRHGGSGGCL